jgi:glycosyltransferase involved in cell wall biosynthesis
MRILYLSDSYLPSESANSVHVVKMAEAFASLGHDVTLVGLRGMPFAGIDDLFRYYGAERNFRIVENNISVLKGRLVLHALANISYIRRFRPDFIFGRSFLSVALAAKLSNAKIGFEIHDPYSRLNTLQKWAFRHILKKASFLVVMSSALKEILTKELGSALRIPVLALHDGASLSAPAHQVSINGVENHKLNIGYIGTVQKGRGVELIVQLSHMLPDFGFHVVGGSPEDISRRLGIKHIPENLYLHGFVSPGQANAFRERFDILLAPYQRETFIKSGANTSGYMSPLKIFEYMAGKKPIIASDLPVLREVLNEHNSILVDPEDLEGWERAITLLSEPQARKNLADTAFKDLVNHYTWKKRTEKIIEQL